jgi:hypothetical protein
VLVVDVVVGQAQRALQQQRLEDGGVEPPVGVGEPVEGAVGDRLVGEGQPERLAEVGVEVAELQRTVALRRRQFLDGVERRDLEVLAERRGERLLPGSRASCG